MSASKSWAEFKFSVIGHLLAAPPDYGELRSKLEELAKKSWKHPTTGEAYQVSFKTLEKWYYQAVRNGKNPIDGLAPKLRSDRGQNRVITDWMKNQLQKEISNHPGRSKKLHFDNLKVLIIKDDKGAAPSYSTINRYMRSLGYQKRKSRNVRRKGYQLSLALKEKFEQRSYEHPYIGSLFHLDFHHCSREIVTERGEIIYPVLLCIIDDCSRLACHAQWYLSESAENLIHGFIQALQKRGLPRALMSDNGKAMLSIEFTSGLTGLSIAHETTLPYSPEQNGKQEVFWSQVEGRMMSMIENKKVITLRELNHMTQAWVEMEYNRKVHSETKSTPLNRYLSFKSVLRSSSDSQELRKKFRRTEKRKVRRTDGTVSLEGKRFEIPQRYRHLGSITIQYQQWDLTDVDIVCGDTGKALCQIAPVNKQKNASGERKTVDSNASVIAEDEIAPIMQDLLKKYSETGLPPAYQPKDEQ